MNFQLRQHHGWSFTDIDNMLPFERDIYTMLLMQYLQEQAEKARNAHG